MIPGRHYEFIRSKVKGPVPSWLHSPDLACLELKDLKGAYLTLLQAFLAFPLTLDVMIYATEMGNRGAQLVMLAQPAGSLMLCSQHM